MNGRKPIGLTIPYREVGYKEKKPSHEALLAEVAVLTELVRVLSAKVTELETAKLKEKNI